MKRPIDYLKHRFHTGATPSSADYGDVLDSYVHHDQQAAVNQQVVDVSLNAYDARQRTPNLNGYVDGLGDLLYLFQGWSDGLNLRKAFDDLKASFVWGNLGGKPKEIPVLWIVQEIDVSPQASNAFPADGSPVWLVQRALAITQTTNPQAVLLDLQVARHVVGSTTGTAQGTPIYADVIMKLRIGMKPVVNP